MVLISRSLFYFYQQGRREGEGARDDLSRSAKENAAEEDDVKSGMIGDEEVGTTGMAIGDESGGEKWTDISLYHAGNIF